MNMKMEIKMKMKMKMKMMMKMKMKMEMKMMAYRHIPTMTKTHHGGFLSAMIMVGFCHLTNSHH